MAVSYSMFSQIALLKRAVKAGTVAPNLLITISNRLNNVCLYSTTTNPDVSTTKATENLPQKKLSKAMLAYLERARAYDAFVKKETEDYKIGKRHLANMMGADPEHFTQSDVDKAIKYLFPSGLYDKQAQPMMKPPEKIFPPKKEAQFDETGRPYHSMFYTTRPNYYKALYDAVEEMQNLNDFEDNNIKKGVSPKPEDKIDFTTSDWLTQKQLEKAILEKVTEQEYEYFIASYQRLADHPYSQKAENTIMKFRQLRTSVTHSLTIPELSYDENGRPFITVKNCIRKSARGTVTVKGAGSGIITVNGQTMLNYFKDYAEREQVSTFMITLKVRG